MSIKSYDSLYEVSNLGNVRNSKTKRALKQVKFRGKLWVYLTYEGNRRAHQVARLVYVNFSGKSVEDVTWKSKNRLDNRFENLIPQEGQE